MMITTYSVCQALSRARKGDRDRAERSRELQREMEERKQVENELRESEERLRAVLDSAPLIVFATDRQGLFTLNAGQALAQIGVRPGQHLGESALELFS